MIEERAIVVSVDGEFAIVETQRKSACGDCSTGAACGTSLIAKAIGQKRNRVRVHNPIQALPGDQVIVGLADSALPKLSFAFYIVPLLALFIGAVIFQWLGMKLNFISTEPLSIGGGLLGLIAGLVWVRRYTSRSDGRKQYQAVILRRIENLSVDIRSIA